LQILFECVIFFIYICSLSQKNALHRTIVSFLIYQLLVMAKKSARVIITLECTEAKKEGKPASRYTTEKNKTNSPDRMEITKYSPFLRRHTLHKEVK
jgi:large subunit ribosomal protein L33